MAPNTGKRGGRESNRAMTLKRGYTPVLRIIQRWRKTPYWRRARRPAAERGSVLARLCRYRHNRAERDLRMAKVKQKVSGCFRTRKYAEAYCRIQAICSPWRIRVTTRWWPFRSLSPGVPLITWVSSYLSTMLQYRCSLPSLIRFFARKYMGHSLQSSHTKSTGKVGTTEIYEDRGQQKQRIA